MHICIPCSTLSLVNIFICQYLGYFALFQLLQRISRFFFFFLFFCFFFTLAVGYMLLAVCLMSIGTLAVSYLIYSTPRNVAGFLKINANGIANHKINMNFNIVRFRLIIIAIFVLLSCWDVRFFDCERIFWHAFFKCFN